jgi:hypothetical protein
MDDDYYEEIVIEIDGWLWNAKDRRDKPRIQRFPTARRLLQAWDHPSPAIFK